MNKGHETIIPSWMRGKTLHWDSLVVNYLLALETGISKRQKEINGKLIITSQQGHEAKIQRNKGKWNKFHFNRWGRGRDNKMITIVKEYAWKEKWIKRKRKEKKIGERTF